MQKFVLIQLESPFRAAFFMLFLSGHECISDFTVNLLCSLSKDFVVILFAVSVVESPQSGRIVCWNWQRHVARVRAVVGGLFGALRLGVFLRRRYNDDAESRAFKFR